MRISIARSSLRSQQCLRYVFLQHWFALHVRVDFNSNIKDALHKKHIRGCLSWLQCLLVRRHRLNHCCYYYIQLLLLTYWVVRICDNPLSQKMYKYGLPLEQSIQDKIKDNLSICGCLQRTNLQCPLQILFYAGCVLCSHALRSRSTYTFPIGFPCNVHAVHSWENVNSILICLASYDRLKDQPNHYLLDLSFTNYLCIQRCLGILEPVGFQK